MENVGNDTAKSDGVPPRMSGMAITYRDVASNYFHGFWRHIRNAPKILSLITGASTRTTRGWICGETAPAGDYMIALMAYDPRFKKAVDQLEAERAFDVRAVQFLKNVSDFEREINECR